MSMQRGYSTPIHIVPRGYYNRDGNYVRTGSREVVGVPVPNPGKVPPSAGHWRTSATARPTPQPRTDPRPTGGKVTGRANPGNPRKRARKSKSNHPTAAALHAAWARGKEV